MVASQDSKAVYITGGDLHCGRQNCGVVLELRCSIFGCAFEPSATTTRVNRESHIALSISDSLANKLCT